MKYLKRFSILFPIILIFIAMCHEAIMGPAGTFSLLDTLKEPGAIIASLFFALLFTLTWPF